MTALEVAKRQRNFSPWGHWMATLSATVHEDPLPLEDQEDFESWRRRRRQRLDELLGPWPEAVPLELETLETVQCEGYARHKVVFDTEATMSVPAFLLVPDGRQGPGPAVLAAHGHGPGKSQVCGLVSTNAPNADYAVQLVRRGYVVLAPDLRCFGERADETPPDHYLCDTNLVHAVAAGRNPLTDNLWDLQRALDVLAQHPVVDPGRIGMVGHSYGGTVTLFLSAIDDRVAASVVSGFFSSWQAGHAVPLNLCGSQVLPGMLGQLEHVDLAAMAVPKPLLVVTGTKDGIWPLVAAAPAMAQLKKVYEWYGATERAAHDVFEAGHEWHGVVAYPFLDRWLGDGTGF